MALTRQDMIDQLVAYSIRAALGAPGTPWLHELFESGFIGFRKLSRAQLVQEMQFRDLLALDDELGEEDGEDEDIVPGSMARQSFRAYVLPASDAD